MGVLMCSPVCGVRFSYVFPCQQWLATDKGDGQISRELVPHDPSRKKSAADSVLEDHGQQHQSAATCRNSLLLALKL